MRDTDEKELHKRELVSFNNSNSDQKVMHKSEASEYGYRSKYSKTKLSNYNPVNPYFGHLRANSGGINIHHGRQPSEPLSVIYYHQSQE